MADAALVAGLQAEAAVMLSTLESVHCLCGSMEVADVSTLSDVVLENKERLQTAEENTTDRDLVDEAVSIQRYLVDLCTKLEVADVSTLSDVVLENKEQLRNAEKELQKLQVPLSSPVPPLSSSFLFSFLHPFLPFRPVLMSLLLSFLPSSLFRPRFSKSPATSFNSKMDQKW